MNNHHQWEMTADLEIVIEPPPMSPFQNQPAGTGGSDDGGDFPPTSDLLLPRVINEEFLTCKICFEPFRRPKILDCLHTFCCACLEAHVRQRGLTDELPCPFCRQTTRLVVVGSGGGGGGPAGGGCGGGGVAALRDNFFVANLRDAMTPSPRPACDEPLPTTTSARMTADVGRKGTICESCSARDDIKMAGAKCLDCQEFLCEECIT